MYLPGKKRSGDDAFWEQGNVQIRPKLLVSLASERSWKNKEAMTGRRTLGFGVCLPPCERGGNAAICAIAICDFCEPKVKAIWGIVVSFRGYVLSLVGYGWVSKQKTIFIRVRQNGFGSDVCFCGCGLAG